jgi:hypothetical protein
MIYFWKEENSLLLVYLTSQRKWHCGRMHDPSSQGPQFESSHHCRRLQITTKDYLLYRMSEFIQGNDLVWEIIK